MEQESIVMTSLLEVQNIQHAHEQYNDFVDISGPLLNISEFKTRQGLPLNEQCAAVFYGKIAHLKDTEFVELDREMLQMIGFKNTFSKKKDKHGNVKKNEHGNPMLADKRHDFHNAIRCLRKTMVFIEGKSFDDSQCHFIVHKAGGDNNQTVWIRKSMLDKWIDFAMFSGKFNQKSNKGIVYFIQQEGDFKRFKIGYTTNLSERLISLQIGTPDLLVVYKTIENATKKKEKQLHRLFAKYHIRGEWFAISPDMIDDVAKTLE